MGFLQGGTFQLQEKGGFLFNATPSLVGNLFEVTFDGQSALLGKARDKHVLAGRAAAGLFEIFFGIGVTAAGRRRTRRSLGIKGRGRSPTLTPRRWGPHVRLAVPLEPLRLRRLAADRARGSGQGGDGLYG